MFVQKEALVDNLFRLAHIYALPKIYDYGFLRLPKNWYWPCRGERLFLPWCVKLPWNSDIFSMSATVSVISASVISLVAMSIRFFIWIMLQNCLITRQSVIPKTDEHTCGSYGEGDLGWVWFYRTDPSPVQSFDIDWRMCVYFLYEIKKGAAFTSYTCCFAFAAHLLVLIWKEWAKIYFSKR